MKFPKLIGSLSPDAGVGLGQERALHNTDAPFLSVSGPGFTARKLGQFSSVEVHETAPALAEPYLWHAYSPVNESPIVNVSMVVADPKRARRKNLSGVGAPGNYISTAGLYVGGGRIAMARFWNDAETHAFASTSSATSRGERAVAATASVARSLFATGWDSVRAGWAWGMCMRPYADNSPGTYGLNGRSMPLQARLVVGEWDSLVTLPHEGGNRFEFSTGLYCAGPGCLVGLVTIFDEYHYEPTGDPFNPSRLAVSRVWPYVVRSNDHGLTWTREEASVLIPYLYDQVYSSYPAPPYDDGRLDFSQVRDMGTLSFFQYVGEGKSLLFLRAARAGWSTSDIGTTVNLCFLYDATTGALSPLTWPYNTATAVPIRAFSLPPLFGGLSPPADTAFTRPSSYCFGTGCCAVFVNDGATTRLRITRDFGSSWEEKPVGTHDTFSFTVVRPYRGPSDPGRILFLERRSGGTDCYVTDGNFDVFTSIGSVLAVGSYQTVEHGVVVKKRSGLYPELPDEFRKG